MPAIRVKACALAAAVVVLDRITKWIVQTRVSPADTYSVIPGFFDIVHWENRGVVFGFLDDSVSEWRTAILIALSLVCAGLVGRFLWKTHRSLDRLSLFGFAMIAGGVAGNLLDRVVRGRVTDFLLFYIGQYQWPAFNVADSALSVGSGLVLLDLLLSRHKAANVS